MKRQTLGELLVAKGRIDALQLKAALAHHRQWGTPLGKILVEHRFCTWLDVLEALSSQTGHPAIDLDRVTLDPALAQLVPERVARQHGVVPVRLEGARGDVLVVAVVAPAGLDSLDAVRLVARKRITPYLASDDAVERAIARLYCGAQPAGEEPTADQIVPLNESTFELEPAATEAAREVLVFGWAEETTARICQLLRGNGFAPRVATQADVILSRPDEVVIAPLEIIEQLAVNGVEVSAQLITAGGQPVSDAARAFWIGAKAFLAAPLDPTRVLDALRRVFDGAPAPRTVFAA